MRVYIGYDEREAQAAEVAAKSLHRVTNGAIEPEFLCMPKLVDQGLIHRLTDHRGGQDYDLRSNETHSTRFKFTRFLTPILCQSGYALFVDCDVVFLRDPRDMLQDVRALYAVNVVKHGWLDTHAQKMVNQGQKVYARKNWSSVALYNCDHPANRRLSLRDVNERCASELHQFYWLHDSEIGSLKPCWNWLVDVQSQPVNTGIAHMTLGGPWLDGWQGGSFDEEWKAAA